MASVEPPFGPLAEALLDMSGVGVDTKCFTVALDLAVHVFFRHELRIERLHLVEGEDRVIAWVSIQSVMHFSIAFALIFKRLVDCAPVKVIVLVLEVYLLYFVFVLVEMSDHAEEAPVERLVHRLIAYFVVTESTRFVFFADKPRVLYGSNLFCGGALPLDPINASICCSNCHRTILHIVLPVEVTFVISVSASNASRKVRVKVFLWHLLVHMHVYVNL